MNALSKTSLCLEVHSLKSALEMRVVTEKRTLKAKDRDYHGEKKILFCSNQHLSSLELTLLVRWIMNVCPTFHYREFCSGNTGSFCVTPELSKPMGTGRHDAYCVMVPPILDNVHLEVSLHSSSGSSNTIDKSTERQMFSHTVSGRTNCCILVRKF